MARKKILGSNYSPSLWIILTRKLISFVYGVCSNLLAKLEMCSYQLRRAQGKGRLSLCHSNKHSMKTINFKAQNSVNLEEEVAKTMETSAAIGFDFSGFEEELVKTVAVEEDTAPSETPIPNSASKKKGKFSNGSIIKYKMKTRNSGIIEEEVSKVMEVGNMLGFDFTGIEQEMSEAIASREVEDLARMEDQEGQ